MKYLVENLKKNIMYDKKQILDSLNNVGICVLEDYFSESDCDQAIQDIERCLVEHEDKVQSLEAEGCGGDERLFKLENQSSVAKKFGEDSFLRDLATSFCEYNSKTIQVVGAKLTYDDNMITNSGGGWHVDSRGKQFKALVYLSDVGKNNGPYMYIPNSANKQFNLRSDSRGTRYLDDVVENCDIEPFTVVAKKGTVILTNTSNIHRGAIIKEGVRYSLTNYYYKADEQTEKVMKSKWGRWYLDEK